MRLTEKCKYDNFDYCYAKSNKEQDNDILVLNKLGQLEDIEDNLPAFNGLQHLFKCIDLMENYEELYFTYKSKSFVLERNE